MPLQILIPAFMISELRRAFEIGFLLFLPFLIIDMVVASVLMSMGMMMLPPVVISLPFKLIFFVLVDGWHLVAGSLVRSFGGLSYGSPDLRSCADRSWQMRYGIFAWTPADLDVVPHVREIGLRSCSRAARSGIG